jgi:hypothetical protein
MDAHSGAAPADVEPVKSQLSEKLLTLIVVI